MAKCFQCVRIPLIPDGWNLLSKKLAYCKLSDPPLENRVCPKQYAAGLFDKLSRAFGKSWKRINLFFMILIASGAFVPSVCSLGISPAMEELNFEPGAIKEFQVRIFGESDPFDVKISTTGELTQYISIEKNMLTVPSEGSTFSYTIKMPDELKPGKHRSSMVIEQQAKKSETGAGKSSFGAMAAVGHVLVVRVPYETKYAEAKIDLPDVIEAGQTIDFKVEVNNYGNEDITSAKGTIYIYYINNSEIISVGTDAKEIKKGESAELYAHWTPKGIGPGEYRAKAVVEYDGKKTEDDATFRIGDIFVEIIAFNPKELDDGRINRIEIEVESRWNFEIKNVYASVDILKNNNRKETITTAPISLPPWKSDILTAFWDTTNYDPNEYANGGEYNAKAVLNYEGRNTIKDFKLFLKSPAKIESPAQTESSSPLSTLTIILIIALAILLSICGIYILQNRQDRDF
ncbi:hypothetical protein HZB03_05525 [Candidatus Woesearchaeota archaeon]|nr:hypothetical protein [Candidatus Woesearchaeota archaeon]